MSRGKNIVTDLVVGMQEGKFWSRIRCIREGKLSFETLFQDKYASCFSIFARST
jgi:hypothetical protein